MGIFNKLGAQNNANTTMQNKGQFQNSIKEIKENPSAYLREKFGFNIPNGENNPLQIVNHLAQTGQLNPNQMRMYQQLQSFNFKR